MIIVHPNTLVCEIGIASSMFELLVVVSIGWGGKSIILSKMVGTLGLSILEWSSARCDSPLTSNTVATRVPK